MEEEGNKATLSLRAAYAFGIGQELEWMELEGKKASRIKTVLNIDVGDSDNWDKCFEWLMKTAQEFQPVFAEQMKKISI